MTDAVIHEKLHSDTILPRQRVLLQRDIVLILGLLYSLQPTSYLSSTRNPQQRCLTWTSQHYYLRHYSSLIMTEFDRAAIKSKASAACGWNFIVLMSRQGKIRLSEFFSSYTESQKKRILRDISADVLPRQAKMCNIIEKGEYKFIYRRYASLYFVVGAPVEMNELIVLEQIHLFVEALDGYFNSGECIVVRCKSLRKIYYLKLNIAHLRIP